jgi:hypothetical protein
LDALEDGFMNRRWLTLALVPIDLGLALMALPAGIVMRLFRRIGARRLRLTKWVLRRIGVFPIADHYYEPLFQSSRLSRPLHSDRVLPGVDLDEEGQLRTLLGMQAAKELVDLQWDREAGDSAGFRFGNGSFESGDAEFLYQFIRSTRPRRIIEIGSGYSTKVARLALERNRSEGDDAAVHTCIEPYEMPWLETLGVEVLRRKVEDCDLEMFQALGQGDLLFIDSSHMIRPQGDVLQEYLAIIPSLRPGVYVHVHDVFTPRDYLEEWVAGDVLFWNEQYLMEALLSGSSRYRVVAAINFLKRHNYEALKRVCPYLDEQREPGSFYFQVVGGASKTVAYRSVTDRQV